MKISYRWLKDYLSFDLSPEEVGEILTSVGLEVEEISKWESVKGGLEGLKVGLVMEVQKHPDADKLTITKVNVGDSADLQIICGAPNVAAGQKVIVATEGVKLYPLKGESFKIKKTKIRGVESQGMICADDEISLGEDHSGIRVLPDDAPVGIAVKDYLKAETDFVFEIGLTPNRGDAMSHIGVDRDLSAYIRCNRNEDSNVKMPDVSSFKPDDHSLLISVEVINPEACPRYTGVTISGITVQDSPDWLQNKLKSGGLRPINNIVDITNFVMLECGQPLHAFDANQISGKKIIVKTLPENSVFKTLDNAEIKLSQNDLMICDENGGMCIAGVYGGIKSGVKENTKNIFLESACFNPKFIRRTSTRHGLRTDAAVRFEKGTDPNLTFYALKRASLLIREICGGKISSEVVDVYPRPIKEKTLSLPYEKLNRVAGIEIPKADTKNILQALQFGILSEDENHITVTVPTFKTDVMMAEDVIEEVLRIYGFEKIPVPDSVRSSLQYSSDSEDEMSEHLADILADHGFHEIISNSITNSEYAVNLSDETGDHIVKILSSANTGLDSLRSKMLFHGLEAVAHNLNRQRNEIRLFEFGKTYSRLSQEPFEELSHIAMWMCGSKSSESWTQKQHEVTFYSLKGMVEALLMRCGIGDVHAEPYADTSLQGLLLKKSDEALGIVATVSRKALESFDIRKPVFYADLILDSFYRFASDHQTIFRELPKLPSVRRDLALVIDRKTSFSQIQSLAVKTSGNLLQNVNLFDVYEDEKLGSEKKSYAVSFIFRDREKTLTDKEVESQMEKLIRTFEKELAAVIRQ